MFSFTGAGNNWAKGHYTEGAELADDAMVQIRKTIEGCESVQAVEVRWQCQLPLILF